jgi:hypothetical protein
MGSRKYPSGATVFTIRFGVTSLERGLVAADDINGAGGPGLEYRRPAVAPSVDRPLAASPPFSAVRVCLRASSTALMKCEGRNPAQRSHNRCQAGQDPALPPGLTVGAQCRLAAFLVQPGSCSGVDTRSTVQVARDAT